MKKQLSKTHCHMLSTLPKSLRRPVASMHAPDLFEVGEDGKTRLKLGRSIMDFMPAAKRSRKSTGAAS